MISREYQKTAIKKAKPLYSGLDALSYTLAGFYQRRNVISKRLLNTARIIDSKSSYWNNLSDKKLKITLQEFRDIFYRKRKDHAKHLPDALGAIREAAKRVSDNNHEPFIVQLAGALSMYHGYIAEMATGEGKTLTAVLTAILWGWSGKPCHIITVNDYLAKRDAKWFSGLYSYCNVSVGCVTSEMEQKERKEGYGYDVTYTTSKEILADFLRDRLWLSSLQNADRRQIKAFSAGNESLNRMLVMRGIHSVIIDEADSILIDEAVTPLIISRMQKNHTFAEACNLVNEIVPELQEGIDFKIDYKFKDIELLPSIDTHIEKYDFLPTPSLFKSYDRRRELIKQALIARVFFHRDKQYVIQDKKVVIVDEFTGRLMPQRTWRAGLHQLIEAKENLAVTSPSETLARLSFQRFFRFFHNISGMTGTAREAAGELWHIYGLGVLKIPENRPCIRTIYPCLFFHDQASKWNAIVNEIIEMNRKGRPVLVGTRNVKESERLARYLAQKNLAFRVLNAIRHEEEARIISHAGEKKAITVATNMAGRGTDIKLGLGVKEIGGLHVIATECHDSARIDRQLFGRSARQGDPGSARSYVSFEDELLVRYLSFQIRKSIQVLLKNKAPMSANIAAKALRWAQRSARNHAYKNRRSVLKMDTWLEDSLSFTRSEIDR